MEKDEIKEKVKICLDEILSASGRLDELQEYCNDVEFNIELVNGSLRKVCKTCKSLVGWPTSREIFKSNWKYTELKDFQNLDK
jgi:hypothetical protein